MIYLDASALVKLLFEEPESASLEQWLTDKTDLPKVSSQLSAVEVLRVCRRYDDEVVTEARLLLAGLDLIPVGGFVIERAASVEPPALRSLDALHLASALSVREGLVGLVTYDRRLAAAAVAENLVVLSPGPT